MAKIYPFRPKPKNNLYPTSGNIALKPEDDLNGTLISEEEQPVGTFGNLYRYKRYYYDPETGLYYLNARYYDPALGRFLTKDPLPGLPIERLSSNSHLYVKNNPVNNEDPSGQDTEAALEVLRGISKLVITKPNPVTVFVGSFIFFMALFEETEGTDPKTKTNAPSRPREQTSNPPATNTATASSSATRTSTQQRTSSNTRSSLSSSSSRSSSRSAAPLALPGPSAEELRRADIQRYSGSFVMPPPLSASEFAGLLSLHPINIPSFQETVVYSASSTISRAFSLLQEVSLPRPQVSTPQVQYNPALGYLWAK